MANKSLILCLIASTSSALTIDDYTQLPPVITQDTEGHFSYDKTQRAQFVLQQALFFVSSQTTLKITANPKGDWSNQCGILACFDGANQLNNPIFNAGRLVFSIHSQQVTSQDKSGYFQLSKQTHLQFNTDFSLTSTQTSDFSSGFFRTLDDATLSFTNANLHLDISHSQAPLLFSLHGTSKLELNTASSSASKSIRLQGNIKTTDSASAKIYLHNPDSYFIGGLELSGGDFELSLQNSRAIFTEYSEALTGQQAQITLNSSKLRAPIHGDKTNLSLSNHSTLYLHSPKLKSPKLHSLHIEDSQVYFPPPPRTPPHPTIPYDGIPHREER